MLYVSFLSGNILNIVIGILIEILMFNIIYSAMDADVDYLKKVLVYAIGMEIEQMILTRYMSPAIFILTFGGYFIVGLLVIFILNKLYDRFEYYGRGFFTVISIGIQFGVSLLINLLFNLYIYIFFY